jgi:ribose transport system permease protein
MMQTQSTVPAAVYEDEVEPVAATGIRRVSHVIAGSTAAWMALLTVVLIVVFGSLSKNHVFWGVPNLQSLGLNVATSLILAVGMTYMLGAGQLDLSVGSMLTLSGVVGAKVMTAIIGTSAGFGAAPHHLALGLVIGVLAAVLTGCACGLINGLLVTRARVTSFIATLATAGIYAGFTLVITNGVDVTGIPQQVQTGFGARVVLGVPLPTIVAVAIGGVLWLLMATTRLGVRTLAVGSSKVSAMRAGIKVDRHIVRLFVLMGFLSGIAALTSISRYGTTDISGHAGDSLAAITAAVIGGTSLFGGVASVGGSMVGSMVPVVLASGLVILGVQSYYQIIVVGLILLVAVALDQRRRQPT